MKPVIFLVLVIVVSGVVGLNYLDNEGYLVFNSKAKAEAIIKEGKDITNAIEIYAADVGDGSVDFGDPSLNEDIFVYLKNEELLIERTGNGLDTNITGWRIADDGKTLQGIVENDDICRYINEVSQQRPSNLPTPECGEPDAEGLLCCSETP